MGNFLVGLGIMVGLQLLGQVLTDWLKLPLPGTLTGMLLLSVLLLMGILPAGKVEGAAGWLLEHMPLFFIPLTVGIMDVWGLFREQLPAVLLVVTVSTLIVLAVTGWTTRFLIDRQDRQAKNEGR